MTAEDYNEAHGDDQWENVDADLETGAAEAGADLASFTAGALWQADRDLAKFRCLERTVQDLQTVLRAHRKTKAPQNVIGAETFYAPIESPEPIAIFPRTPTAPEFETEDE